MQGMDNNYTVRSEVINVNSKQHHSHVELEILCSPYSLRPHCLVEFSVYTYIRCLHLLLSKLFDGLDGSWGTPLEPSARWESERNRWKGEESRWKRGREE